jgi:hypothetical protein
VANVNQRHTKARTEDVLDPLHPDFHAKGATEVGHCRHDNVGRGCRGGSVCRGTKIGRDSRLRSRGGLGGRPNVDKGTPIERRPRFGRRGEDGDKVLHLGARGLGACGKGLVGTGQLMESRAEHVERIGGVGEWTCTQGGKGRGGVLLDAVRMGSSSYAQHVKRGQTQAVCGLGEWWGRE